MKQLSNYIAESLLDDFDEIEKKSECDIYIQYFYETWRKNSKKPLCDWCGNKIKVGDLVIYHKMDYAVPGIVLDIKDNKIAVSRDGNVENLKIQVGPLKGQISSTAYIYPNHVMKITPKILKAIYNIK